MSETFKTRVKTGGRKLGTPNKSTVDNRKLEEHFISLGYRSVAEIAFLTANELFDVMCAVEEEHGHDSKEFAEAAKNSISATKTALPYFTNQIKTLVLTSDEDFSEDSIAAKAQEILDKYKKSA